jgi:RES domain-containing protein
MKVWRIATETHAYGPEDLSGMGAFHGGGRWNSKGRAVVYTASSIALATLEVIAHLERDEIPQNRFLVEIDVPDTVWQKRLQRVAADLPPTWSAIPAGRTCAKLGDDWLDSQGSCVMCVPSVIVPEEMNVLINPSHPDTDKLTVRVLRRIDLRTALR